MSGESLVGRAFGSGPRRPKDAPHPAPWRVYEPLGPHLPWRIASAVFPGLSVIAQVTGHENGEHNARLMGAAPELLEMLKKLDRSGAVWPDLRSEFDAVIAKAEGRS